jgi:hypothetical protein
LQAFFEDFSEVYEKSMIRQPLWWRKEYDFEVDKE